MFERDDDPQHSADEQTESQWRQSRLDEFHELDARGGSEALRMHLAKELFHCHFEMLELGRLHAARRHLDELRGIVARHAEDTSPSRIVRTQWLWFARTLVEAMERAASYEACVAMLAELSLARTRIGDTEEMREVWAAGLEHACAVALRCGRGVAVEHLSSLSWGADRRSRAQALSLARALAAAHREALQQGEIERAGGHLDELRALASLPTASGYPRAALTGALRRSHAQAADGQRGALLGELRQWAGRHDATQEQRNDYAAALEVGGNPWSEAPDEFLRRHAYRSAGGESRRELFSRLERRAEEAHGLLDFVAVAADLRDLAAQPGASEELRLRFARVWLEARLTPVAGSSQADHDRVAYQWALDAARAGDASAAVLVGHCHRSGRGVPLSLVRARRWYQQAARAGEPSGDDWQRQCVPWSRRRLWLLHRFPGLLWAGAALLAIELWRNPPTVDGLGLLAYLVLLYAGQHLVKRLLDRGRPPSREEAGGGELPRGRWWEPLLALLGVVREDGLFVVPVLWLGVSPLTAVLGGAAFGAAHYPGYPWRWCVAKAVVFAIALLFILPWAGLGTMVIGHLVFDALVFGAAGQLWPRRNG